jgi:hypothetical protein
MAHKADIRGDAAIRSFQGKADIDQPPFGLDL